MDKILINKYREGLVKDRDFNCAEKVLNLSNEVLAIDLPDKALKVAAGFGAGMGIGHLCGAISGAIMVLSLQHVESVGHQSEIKKIEKEFLYKVEEKLGSLMCKELLNNYYSKETKCEYIMESVIEILDDFVEKKNIILKLTSINSNR